MHRIINMNVMTAAIFLMMGTCFSKANAEEINGVKYTVDGSSVGEKYWEKQVINTNLYDTDEGGTIVFDYSGAWTQEEGSLKGLKCTKKPGFGVFPISIQEKTPLMPLIKIKLAGESIEKTDKGKNVYQFKANGDRLVIIRTILEGDPSSSWVKLHAPNPESPAIEQKTIDSWPTNNVYIVKVKKGDVLEFSSPGLTASVWDLCE